MKYLFVFAHPDDETFSSGGTIALLSKAENTVSLICATRGEAGELGTPPIATKENIGEIRESELRNASRIIGIKTIYFLNYIDATLKKVSRKELSAKILTLLKKEKPDVVITFDESGGSNHPDHIAMSHATSIAFDAYLKITTKTVKLYHTAIPKSYLAQYANTKLEYKAFGKIHGVDDERITTIVDISKTYKDKLKASACHRTQNKDWNRFLERAKVMDLKKEFFRLVKENNLR